MAARKDVLIALAGSEVVAVTSDLLEWRWADFGPEELGDWWVSVTAISAWSGGLVAVGLDHHADQPVIWHYRGDHFQKIEMGQPEGPGSAVMDVTPFGEGLVAVGSSGQLPRGDDRSAFPVVWVSSDGLSWSRIEIPTEEWSVKFTHVTASGQGLVALGLVTELDNPEAVGTSFPDPFDMENFRQPFAWVSVDGQSWDREDLPIDEASLFDLAATPFGFVAVGTVVGSDRSAVMLVSPDGKSWSQVPAASLGGDTLLTDVTSHQEWTYAVGDDVFVSQDGVSWIELGLSGQFRSITSFGGRLVTADGNSVVELSYPPQQGR